jgi:hypothetical protein
MKNPVPGRDREALGRFRGGLTCKIHLLADALQVASPADQRRAAPPVSLDPLDELHEASTMPETASSAVVQATRRLDEGLLDIQWLLSERRPVGWLIRSRRGTFTFRRPVNSPALARHRVLLPEWGPPLARQSGASDHLTNRQVESSYAATGWPLRSTKPQTLWLPDFLDHVRSPLERR